MAGRSDAGTGHHLPASQSSSQDQERIKVTASPTKASENNQSQWSLSQETELDSPSRKGSNPREKNGRGLIGSLLGPSDARFQELESHTVGALGGLMARGWMRWAPLPTPEGGQAWGEGEHWGIFRPYGVFP